MLEILLIVLYVTLFSKFALRHRFFKAEGLEQSTLTAVFVLKVVSGIIYGIIYQINYWGGDTYVFFRNADLIFKTFPSHPMYYLQNMVGIHVDPPEPGLFSYPPQRYYFGNFGVYTLLHIQAVIRAFSFGYYNIHVVFNAFISTISGVALYKVFNDSRIVPRRTLIAVIFFVPSLVFWTSGIHKDGFVYFGLSILLLGVYHFFKGFRLKGVLFSLLGLFIITIIRGYLLVLLFPALIALVWTIYDARRAVWKFIIVYATCVALVFSVQLIKPNFDIVSKAVVAQQAFSKENGNSDFYVPPLEETWQSVLMFTPIAFTNALVRPTILECHDFLQYLASFEMLVFMLMVVLCSFYYKRVTLTPFFYFALFYGISNLLLIGFLLSNSGTIARYRAVALGFMVLVLVAKTNYNVIWIKILRRLSLSQKNDADDDE